MIFCLYVSKGCSFDILVKSLEAFGFNGNQHSYLVGDLNFDATGENALTKYLKRLNFIQMVKRATHLDGHILDHVYVPQKEVKYMLRSCNGCWLAVGDGCPEWHFTSCLIRSVSCIGGCFLVVEPFLGIESCTDAIIDYTELQ